MRSRRRLGNRKCTLTSLTLSNGPVTLSPSISFEGFRSSAVAVLDQMMGLLSTLSSAATGKESKERPPEGSDPVSEALRNPDELRLTALPERHRGARRWCGREFVDVVGDAHCGRVQSHATCSLLSCHSFESEWIFQRSHSLPCVLFFCLLFAISDRADS
jgi:hypothetical protein